ncbi:MAG: Fis family transcriptional regulator [Pyrobaculum sp.]
MKLLTALAAKLRGAPLAMCDSNDVDGIASAALFLRRYPNGVVVLMGPSDVRRWWVKTITWDFVADLPCPGKARVRADHHKTNKPCAEVEYYDPEAPAAALMAVKALGLDGDPVAKELVEAAIQTDTANVVDEKVRLLDLAVRHGFEKEKLEALPKLAQRGLAALEEEPLKTMAARGLEKERLMLKIAEAIPVEEELFIYSPQPLGISYRALVITLEKRGAKFVNVLVRRGRRRYRLYCGAHREGPHDCTKVATALGGGGHKYASGAQIKAPLLRPREPLEKLLEMLKPPLVYVLGSCDELRWNCKEIKIDELKKT